MLPISVILNLLIFFLLAKIECFLITGDIASSSSFSSFGDPSEILRFVDGVL